MVFRQFIQKASSAASILISKPTNQASRPKSQIYSMFNESGRYRPHILVIGGAYGGLSVVANLINLIAGNPQLSSAVQPRPLDSNHKLQAKPRITILDERDGIFHTMGAPMAHTSKDFVSEAWMPYKDVKYLTDENVKILRGRAVNIDMATKIATYMEVDSHDASNSSEQFQPLISQSPQIESGEKAVTIKRVPYDYLVVATGMQRAWPIVPKSLTKEGYVRDAEKHIGKLNGAEHIAVVGGGK